MSYKPHGIPFFSIRTHDWKVVRARLSAKYNDSYVSVRSKVYCMGGVGATLLKVNGKNTYIRRFYFCPHSPQYGPM